MEVVFVLLGVSLGYWDVDCIEECDLISSVVVVS